MPNKLYLSGQRGTTIDRDITISTSDANDVPIRLTIESFTLDSDGLPLHKPSSLPQSITLSASTALIHAGERFPLHVQIAIPADADGTSWSALMIEPASESNREGLRVRSRFGVPIFVTADGTEKPDASIDGIKAVVRSPDDILVVARIRNTGNTVLRCPVAFAIESQGDEIATAEKDEVLILPGATRLIAMHLTGGFQSRRDLEAVAFVRYGTGKNQVAKATTVVMTPATTTKTAALLPSPDARSLHRHAIPGLVSRPAHVGSGTGRRLLG